MKFLLDTCTFLWASLEPERLSSTAIAAIQNPENELYLSLVSSWEITMKYSAKKLILYQEPKTWLPQQRAIHRVEPIALPEEVIYQEPHLPAVHRDPFDRMLICQAIHSGLTILTPDPYIQKYPVLTTW